jgi:phage terminase small subunit
MAKLTAKQRLFVSEYLVSLNATQAAIKAGYSQRTAYSIGDENLKKPEVIKALQKALADREKRTEITADYVLKSLKEVAERCMQKVPVMYYDKENKCMEQETALVTHPDGSVKEEGVWEFDSSGANKSLELLGKHLKLFTDKTEHSGPGGGPINIKIGWEDGE